VGTEGVTTGVAAATDDDVEAWTDGGAHMPPLHTRPTAAVAAAPPALVDDAGAVAYVAVADASAVGVVVVAAVVVDGIDGGTDDGDATSDDGAAAVTLLTTVTLADAEVDTLACACDASALDPGSVASRLCVGDVAAWSPPASTAPAATVLPFTGRVALTPDTPSVVAPACGTSEGAADTSPTRFCAAGDADAAPPPSVLTSLDVSTPLASATPAAPAAAAAAAAPATESAPPAASPLPARSPTLTPASPTAPPEDALAVPVPSVVASPLDPVGGTCSGGTSPVRAAAEAASAAASATTVCGTSTGTASAITGWFRSSIMLFP
jgi:hypothetical protein